MLEHVLVDIPARIFFRTCKGVNLEWLYINILVYILFNILARTFCSTCQGVNLEWLYRYLHKTGRYLQVVHLQVDVYPFFKEHFTEASPIFYSIKGGKGIYYGGK